MNRLWGAAPVFAALLLCIRPADAQISADSLQLARAVAAYIELMYSPGEKREPVLILPAETPFDSAVAAALSEWSRARPSVRDSTHLTRVGTRGMMVIRETAELRRIAGRGIVRDLGSTLQGGTTVAVVVEDRGSKPEDGSLLTTWSTRYAYLFTRTADGWSSTGVKELSTSDGGIIRDEPEPGVRVRKDGG